MASFTADHAKKLVARFWAGEKVESLAEEEDVAVDKIIELMLNADGDVRITIPLTSAEFDAVSDSRGHINLKRPIQRSLVKILGGEEDLFESDGVIVHTFTRGNVKLHSARNGVDIDFTFNDYAHPTSKEINAMPTMRIKLINLFKGETYEAARQAKDLIHGEMSGLLRDAEKTKGLAKEGSPLDRALAAGILPQSVGKFLTSEDVKGYSVKPTVNTIKKKHYGVGRTRARRRKHTRRQRGI